MKSNEANLWWNGVSWVTPLEKYHELPPLPSGARQEIIPEESLSDAMDRLHHDKHAKFRRWQDALVMRQIFGDDYVTIPEIPKGYEAYAKWWYDNELKAFK